MQAATAAQHGVPVCCRPKLAHGPQFRATLMIEQMMLYELRKHAAGRRRMHVSIPSRIQAESYRGMPVGADDPTIVLAAQIRRSSCSQAALQEASNRISAHCPTRQVFNQIRKLNLPNAKLHSLPGCADRFQLSYHTRWKLWSTAMHA